MERLPFLVSLNGPETWLRSQAVEVLLNVGANIDSTGLEAAKLSAEQMQKAAAMQANGSNAGAGSARPTMKFHGGERKQQQFAVRGS